MKAVTYLFFIGTLFLFQSCSSKQDSLMGEWTDENTETEFFTIEKFGNNLTLINLDEEFPLTKKGENYSVNILGQEMSLVFDSQAKKILFDGNIYLKFEESLKKKLLGKYYAYDDVSETINEQEGVSIRRRDDKRIFVYFSNTDKRDGELHYSKNNGLTYYSGKRDYYGNRLSESISLIEINGKACIKFEGGSEGDFWEYLYCVL